jgi:hypothetical protein
MMSGGEGEGGQKVLSKPSADSFAVGRRQKGKDKTVIKGWRPISLVNHDAKLYAKVICERLRMICKTVIGPEQLSFVEKGLSMRGTSSSTKCLNYLKKES